MAGQHSRSVYGMSPSQGGAAIAALAQQGTAATRHVLRRYFGTMPRLAAVGLHCLRQLQHRVLIVLVLATYLPASIAAIACEADCAAQEMLGLGMGHHQSGAEDHALGDGATPLHHSGPCHLMFVPAVIDGNVARALEGSASVWSPGYCTAYASVVWPPPRHPPKF